MADHTKIEWTDRTWNPVTGCTKASAGCDHCYAETIAERFRGGPAFPNGFDVQLREQKLTEPLRWRKPSKVFVNSMSDLFHDAVPDEYIAEVFAVMASAPQHTFQVLTKRHARMRSLLGEAWLPDIIHRGRQGARPWPLPNVWLGVSVEDQKWADIRIPALLNTPAAIRFISAEPLLGPVNLQMLAGRTLGWNALDQESTAHPALDWVIVGGESGRGARPMHPQWARLLRDQCRTAEVPFLFKQWGQWAPAYYMDDTPTSTYVLRDGSGVLNRTEALNQYGKGHPMRRVGKGKAGRELDGRTWDQFPERMANDGA